MQRILLHQIKATVVFRVNTTCSFTTARGRILDAFPDAAFQMSYRYKYFHNLGKPGLAEHTEMG
jgi:hypothetical protein